MRHGIIYNSAVALAQYDAWSNEQQCFFVRASFDKINVLSIYLWNAGVYFKLYR